MDQLKELHIRSVICQLLRCDRETRRADSHPVDGDIAAELAASNSKLAVFVETIGEFAGEAPYRVLIDKYGRLILKPGESDGPLRW